MPHRNRQGTHMFLIKGVIVKQGAKSAVKQGINVTLKARCAMPRIFMWKFNVAVAFTAHTIKAHKKKRSCDSDFNTVGRAAATLPGGHQQGLIKPASFFLPYKQMGGC